MCGCNTCCKNRYGFFSFLGDLTMLVLTCGLWIIWIFCREMRKSNRGSSRCGC